MSTHDPEFYQTPKSSPEKYEAPPRQRGCFFYGCIIASVLALLMAILVAIIAFVAYRWAGRMVDEYTGTAPEQLPTLEMPAEKRQAVKDRVKSFQKAVEAETAIEPLVLSSDDLNALIEDKPDLKGKIYVKVDGDEIKGRISLPLDELKLPLPMIKGRYLNGEADLKASLFDGELIVHLDAFEVNGKKPSDQVMTELRKQNIAKDVAKDKDLSAMLRKIESLEIKDGNIILKVRAKPAGAGTGTGTGKTATPVEVVPSGNGQPKTTEPSKNGEPKPAAEPAHTKEPAPKP
jgi:hypothetical protein